jgi:cobalt/nickel transport system permease protein
LSSLYFIYREEVMHMADALISPAVGVSAWGASALTIAYCSKKLKNSFGDEKLPLMGVLGAFIFAAQMINFTIPATGSSGHIGGALLLAILLGPYAGIITIASVLVVQALMFADGGLLALGCNIFNLGFFPCFVAYPFIYKKIAKDQSNKTAVMTASVIATVIGLQLGSFMVVLQTMASGITELPFTKFLALMQPIHLAIGIVEGIITAGVLFFVMNAKPEIFAKTAKVDFKGMVAVFFIAALFVGGVASWYASSHPDGLEWSIEKTAGVELEAPATNIYKVSEKIQEKTALLPDYAMKNSTESNIETTVSGVVGGLLTLSAAFLAGFALRKRERV